MLRKERSSADPDAERIEKIAAAGIRPGLGPIRRMLHMLGDPQDQLRVAHVAGTNAKGSTARMIAGMLQAAGYRTGLFSSPAVTGCRDTITIDGRPIPPPAFEGLVQELAGLQRTIPPGERLTAFELTTVLMLTWFAREKTDLCVVECGLGGRDDATNVFAAPLVGVITPIALDHTDFLGDTLAAIATNKAAILKPPCRVVVAREQPEEAMAVLRETARCRGLSVVVAPPRPALDVRLGRLRFLSPALPVELRLTGAFQADNALTALAAVDSLAACGYPVGQEARLKGLREVTMPCRQEVLQEEPLRMLDGAHNPQGVRALADTLRTMAHRPLTAIIGMLRDKDTAACAALLSPFCDRVVCTRPPNPRALAPEILARQMARPGAEVFVREDPLEALHLGQKLAGSGGLLVAGSFYLCACLRPELV